MKVTGAKGFIGQYLVQRLKQEPAASDVIFHLAAITRNEASIQDPILTMETNVSYTTRLLQMARRENLAVVYASSSVIYNPIRTPYQISKIAADSIAQWYNENGGDVRIVRLADVYGLGMKKGVIAAWREQYRRNGIIDVWEGPQRRDYLHLADAVNALILAAKMPKGVYEVCTGIQTELGDLAKMLDVPFRRVPTTRPIGVEQCQVRDERFPIRVSLEEGMAEIRKEFHDIR